MACQASNVDLCAKSQNPLNVEGGLATKNTTMGTLLVVQDLRGGVATEFDTADQQLMQADNVPNMEL